MYRCGICNVISRDLREHDKHLSGKRHKRNFSLAAAAGDGARARTEHAHGVHAHSAGSHGAKRQRQRARDLASVDAAMERLAADASVETEALLFGMLTGGGPSPGDSGESANTAPPQSECDAAVGRRLQHDESSPAVAPMSSEQVSAVKTHLESRGGADRITRVGSKFGLRKMQLAGHFHIVWVEASSEHFVSLSASLPQAPAHPPEADGEAGEEAEDLDGEPLLESELIAAVREQRMLEELAQLHTTAGQGPARAGSRPPGRVGLRGVGSE
ncbi:unnamed protein product [Prorocentrum cordatum]|uniref:U1-type domain-containing protein n=1 Tax=Prorocentrum cordatum TaxID=2364126 RepID=A0ABN9ULM8_9DINO|nr:unnamed protein product [Polarella glacialis]